MSTDGLRFYNLSHQLGHNMVQWPSPFSKPFVANRLYYHAMHDFYAVEYDGIMHRGTHMDTPAHVEPDQPYLDGFDVWRFFGTGVAVSIPKKKWGVITAQLRLADGAVVRESLTLAQPQSEGRARDARTVERVCGAETVLASPPGRGRARRN